MSSGLVKTLVQWGVLVLVIGVLYTQLKEWLSKKKENVEHVEMEEKAEEGQFQKQ